MAAASYTHDLTDWIADSDTTAWGELTNAASGGAPDEVDTESALQGTNTVSQITNTTSLCSMVRILAAPVDLTNKVALVWHGHGVATALDLYANGGLGVAFATALGNWKSYNVAGVDTPPFPYGKWINSAVDPSLTPDSTNGTAPGVSVNGIGSTCKLTQVVARGQPHVCDIIRTGRAEARINGGDLANGYATFAGFATLNDAQTARWGLIQSTSGGYLWKGLMTLGYTSAVDFRDSNTNIFIQDCRKVGSTFNKIEIRQAGSRVDWTNISFLNTSPTTNASKGALEVIDDADVNFDGCTFTDMGTFAFLSNSSNIGTTFRRCDQVTLGGSTMTNCLFARSTATVALACGSSVSTLSNTDFISSGTGHAIEITGGSSHTLTGITFSGYAASNGSTGNEAVYVNIASGDVTIYADSTFSYRTAGATVTIIAGAVTATLTVTNTAGTAIQNANVYLAAANGTGDLPYQDSVTIANSGTTATVTHTGHGMLTNDKVHIVGASHAANNGVFTITVTGANTYTYTMATAPGSNPTGTITATWTAMYGLTDANGQISVTRVFGVDQPVTGWARKSSAAPYYKTGPVSGTIDSGTGAAFTSLLISDE